MTMFSTVVSLFAIGIAQQSPQPNAKHQDLKYSSVVFGEARNFRIFLPRDYATSDKRYAVIYYFHGHSDRYTLEHYDKGQDTVPKVARFAAENRAEQG